MNLPPPTLHLIEEIAAIAALVLVLHLLRGLLETLFKPSKRAISYVLNTTLVTPAERSFLGCLDSVLPTEIRVLTKVRVADIFSVDANRNAPGWRAAFNRIQSKHVDFVLCRSDDLSPLAAIELDDKSHDRTDRQERDQFLNELFATSRIKLLRVKAQRNYDTGELARRLNEAMQPGSALRKDCETQFYRTTKSRGSKT
jgi:hypothetical protein